MEKRGMNSKEVNFLDIYIYTQIPFQTFDPKCYIIDTHSYKFPTNLKAILDNRFPSPPLFASKVAIVTSTYGAIEYATNTE